MLGLSNTELIAPKLVGELLAVGGEIDRPQPQGRENNSAASGNSKARGSVSANVIKAGNETSASQIPQRAKTTLPLPEGEGELSLKNPRAISVQFRYAFVTDDDGLKVIDISNPTKPRLIPNAFVPLQNAQGFYLARTYAYVANGAEGLALIDIENPEKPKLLEMFNAGGALNDTRAVQIGSVNASMFALVADGRNGLRVLQMISPENVPGHMGFSPRPNPKLIATYKTHGDAVAVSRGLDRDRVADETGNQTVVFGRRGSRPFNYEEMQTFFRHFDDPFTTNRVGQRTGDIYKVEDVITREGKITTPSGRPFSPPLQMEKEPEPESKRIQRQRLERRGG